MKLNSVVQTPPAGLPVTVAAFKDFVRQYSTHEDTMLQGVLAAAVTRAEEYLGVSLEKQSRIARIKGHFWERTQPGRTIDLDMGPVHSITSIKYYDPNGGAQVLIDPSFYELVVDSVRPLQGAQWPMVDPARLDAFEIIYVAGEADHTVSPAIEMRDIIKTGVFLYAQAIYERRIDCETAAENVLSTLRKGQGI